MELKSNKIKMAILRGGAPVTVVPLGEKVELRWTGVLLSSLILPQI